MSRIYDLHCHSDQSDGILSPESLVSRAKSQDVEVLALTDHDTINGLSRAKQQAHCEGIELIAGIEFSCQWQGRGIHLVGLNIDTDAAELTATIHQQAKIRDDRAITIAQKLESLGLGGALEGARKHANGGVVGRPHFASYMVERGFCKNVQQAFKKYLGAGKVGDVKQVWPSLSEITEVILRAGGVPVVAHPSKYNMTRTKLCAMVEDFKNDGGLALEVVSGAQEANTTRDLANIANTYGMLASCGSDFHAPGQRWQELGRFTPLPENVDAVWHFWE